MRVVLQRVSRASVTVEGEMIGQIGRGLLLLVGVHLQDGEREADSLARKCAELRIFPDEQGKMNLSAMDLKLEALVVSQFTLYGDCRKGRRPNFMDAARPELGNALYERFVHQIGLYLPRVATGRFGAMMQVELVNDGPVTLILEERGGSGA